MRIIQIENLTVTYFGRSAFLVKAENFKFFFDPYRLPVFEEKDKADLLLVSHSHEDHCSKAEVAKIVTEETKIYGPQAVEDVLGPRVKVVIPGDVIKEKGVEVEIIRAYNEGSHFHPLDFGVGFKIKMAGQTLYFAGDTDLVPEVRDQKGVDAAFLPIGGTYTMDFEDAAEAVKIIKPRYVIPMHYGGELENTAESFAHAVGSQSQVVIFT